MKQIIRCQPTFKKSSWNLPLRWVLIVPFVVQTVGAVGFVGFLSWRAGKTAVQNLATQLMIQVNDRVQQRLQYYLEVPQVINKINIDAIQEGRLDVNDPDSLTRQFWRQRFLFSQVNVSAMYFGSAAGTFAGLGYQNNNAWEASRVDSTTGYRFRTYSVDSKGNLGQLASEGKVYDPRSRPWYKDALRANKLTWSEIYVDFKEPRLKITAAEPIYAADRSLKGVIGTDFVLNHVADYLSQLQVGQTGKVFIIERSGKLVAASSGEPLALNKQRIDAINSRDAIIRETAYQLRQQLQDFQHIKTQESLQVDFSGQSHLVQVTPFVDRLGLDWLIVVIVPESDFTREITNNAYNTLRLCLATLFLSIIIGVLTSRWVTQSLRQLSVASQNIAKGNLNQAVNVPVIQELNVLAESFNQMSQDLCQSQLQLEDYARSLERRVQERTQALETKNTELETTLYQLRSTQAQLIHAEKLAALGQLVAGVAHEINTPLAAIRSSITNIRSYVDDQLAKLPDFLSQLTIPQRHAFLHLINTASTAIEDAPLLSSREKRQLKRTLVRQLENNQEEQSQNEGNQDNQNRDEQKNESRRHAIENASEIADLLVEMRVGDRVQEFSPLLHAANGVQILLMADQILSVQRSAQTIMLASDRAAKAVFALKSYAHQETHQNKIQVAIIAGLETVLTLYQHQLKQGVEVVKHYNELPLIDGYPDELYQVWTNLIDNALHAMQYQGKLTIATHQQNQEIYVSITDTGHGISHDVQTRLFEPFFTTKAMGEGTGLGLSIVKQVIDKHQGRIEVNSMTGRTTFTVILPVH